MRQLLERLILLEAKGDVTGASVKRSLNADDLRLDFHDKSIMTRQVDVAPGVAVKEMRGTKMMKRRLVPGGKSKYRAIAYQGKDAKPRWSSSGDVDLKAAVTWINRSREEAGRHYKEG